MLYPSYLRTGEIWLYLCPVLVFCSGKVVRWSMAPVQDWHLVLIAVMMARWQQPNCSEVILHSHRGMPFNSSECQHFLRDHRINSRATSATALTMQPPNAPSGSSSVSVSTDADT